MDREIAAFELSKKLDASHVKPPKKFGPKGDYIESWHAISEANRIFGHFGWSATNIRLECVSERPRKIGEAQKDGWAVTYVCTREIIVDGAVRQGSGAGHGYDLDAGLAHESAVKEAESDAEKRALRTFGNPFGLALYDKTRENVESKAEKYVADTERLFMSSAFSSRTEVAEWWNSRKAERVENGLTKDDSDFLIGIMNKRFPATEEAA